MFIYRIIFLLLIYSGCYAQQLLTVNGKVIDSKTKLSLPYTMMAIKNSSQAAFASENGNFSFSYIHSQTDTIIFSLMGYAQKKFPVITLSLYDSLIIELDEKSF